MKIIELNDNLKKNDFKVSIIVANYNAEKWLKKFIQSVNSQNFESLEVIIIDNNSIDNSEFEVRKIEKYCKYIKSEVNHGFGVGNNIAIEHSSGKVILLLNTDTFFDNNFIELLYLSYLKNENSILGPKVLDYEGNDHYRGMYLSVDPLGYVGFGKRPFFIEGCALMIGKKQFLNLGGFDKEYFIYSEDIDLCWRGKLSGMEIRVCNETNIYHYGGGTSVNTIYDGKKYISPLNRRKEVEKNNIRNILKLYSLPSLIIFVPVAFLILVLESLFYIGIGQPKAAWKLLEAVAWNIKKLPSTISERGAIKKIRKISDFKILLDMSGLIPNKLRGLLLVGVPKFK